VLAMHGIAFRSALKKQLFPVLRSEGFGGSRQTLRRAQGPWLHVFQLQSDGPSGWCYLNVGAHLDVLPPEGGLPVPRAKFEEPHCAFRDRVDPPTGPSRGWVYLSDPVEIRESVAFMLE
jgi:Domain of unknown function (DUF4304)